MEQGRPALTEIIIIPDSYLTQDSTFDILFNEIRLGRFTNLPWEEGPTAPVAHTSKFQYSKALAKKATGSR